MPRAYKQIAFKYLTLKQKKFCFEYLKLKNAKQAALNAGFNASYSVGLLNKPIIKGYIKYLMEKVEQQSMIDAAWKREQLKKIVDNCLNTESGPALARQNEHSAIDPKSALAAIAEMNKMDGTYAPEKKESKFTFDAQNLVNTVESLNEY